MPMVIWRTSEINLGKFRIPPSSSLLGLPFNLVVTTVIANTATTGSKSATTNGRPKAQASTKEASF